MKNKFMYLLLLIIFDIILFAGLSFMIHAEAEDFEESTDIEETIYVDESELEITENEQSDIETEPQEQSEDHENCMCICGRDYYTVTTTEHRKYDCTRCDVSSLTCRCDCWCGAKSFSEISVSGETVLFCSNCGNTCIECACADREIAILREKQTENGLLSIMGIQKPTNIFACIFMILFFALLFVFCYYAAVSVNGVNLSTESSEKPIALDKINNGKSSSSVITNPVSNVISSFKKLINDDENNEKAIADSRVILKSAPTLQLYNILCSQYRGILGGTSQPVSPECSYKLAFTGSDMAELCFLSGLNTNGSPLKPIGTIGDATALESFGLSDSTNDGAVITAKGKALASVLFTPDEVISVRVSNGCIYDYCLHRGYGIVSVLSNNIYNLYSNVTREDFCDFINNLVVPRNVYPEFEKISEEFTYEQWMTFLSASAEKGDTIGLRSLARLEKVDQFNAVFNGIAGYPKPEDVLSADSAIRILASLKEKGLLDGEGFSYSLSEKGKLFSFDSVKDTVSFIRENPGAGTAALLFVYKTDRILNICDTGNSIKIVSCKNIQWDKIIN